MEAQSTQSLPFDSHPLRCGQQNKRLPTSSSQANVEKLIKMREESLKNSPTGSSPTAPRGSGRRASTFVPTSASSLRPPNVPATSLSAALQPLTIPGRISASGVPANLLAIQISGGSSGGSASSLGSTGGSLGTGGSAGTGRPSSLQHQGSSGLSRSQVREEGGVREMGRWGASLSEGSWVQHQGSCGPGAR